MGLKKRTPSLNTSQGPIKAVGYIRVSRLKHHKNHVSPETQIEAIKNYCQMMGWELVATFDDLDRSGYKRKSGKLNYEDRPGLMAAIDYVKEQKINKLVVWKFSRLGRRIREAHEIIDLLENMGCDVVCTSLNIDTGTPMGRLVRNIMIDFDEFYSEDLAETIYDNKAINAEAGRWNGGNVPYGLKWLPDKKEFTEDEGTFPFLQEIFRLAIRGWSSGRIALEMQMQGAPCPMRKWNADSVRYILRNPIYIGMPVWDGEARRSRYKCFIDKELFERVQAILDKNSKIAPRTLGSQHILTPLLVCGKCGSRMDVKWNGSPGWKRRRYHCSHKYALLHEERCYSPYYDAESLEAAVVEQLRRIAYRDDFFDAILAQAAGNNYSQEAIKKEIAALEAQQAALARAENELFDDCYIKKIISQEQFLRQNQRLHEKQEQIEQKIEDASRLLRQDRGQAVAAYRQELLKFTSVWDTMDIEEKRELIGSVVDEITIMPDKAIIKLLFGEAEIPTYESRRVKFFRQKEKDAANI